MRARREHALHLGALHAAALAVDQPDLGEAGLAGRLEVGLDDGRDLGGAERMQVEGVFDGNDDGVLGLRHGGSVTHPSPEDVVSTRPPRW